MPRPRKCRRICAIPQNHGVLPIQNVSDSFTPDIIMNIDEYETIRLMDFEGLTQMECAAQMNIARTTVTAIYEAARKKMADALVNGKSLAILGGDYVVCENANHCCGRCGRSCAGCNRQCAKKGEAKNDSSSNI